MAEATDMQRLVVSMEARFTTFTKELQKVTRSVDGESQKIERRFKAVNDNLAGQTANLAAQFQDIGVQLASGTSPLTVALQQGTQIAAVLGESRGGAAGAVKSLGAAFASVISPLSLATIGIIALGGAAIQYITGASEDVETLDDHLKAHGEIIKSLKDAYGEAAEGLDQYAKESTRVLETQIRVQIVKLTEDLRNAANEIAKTVNTAAPAFTDMATGIGFGGVDLTVSDKFKAFADAIKRFTDEAAAGTPNVKAFREAISEIERQNLGDEQIRKVAGELLSMSDKALTAENALRSMQRAISLTGEVASGQVNRVKDLISALRELAGIAMPTLSDADRAAEAYRKAIESAQTPGERRQADEAYLAATQRIRDREAERKAEEAARQAARSSRSGSGGSSAPSRDVYAEEIAEIQMATQALEREFEMLGKSNVEREKARAIMEVENALRREGVTLSDDQRANVEQLAQAYAEMSTKLKEANATQRELEQLASSTIKGFVSDLLNGVDAAKALENALGRIGDKLLDIAIDSALKGIFGGGSGSGGGLFGSLFGGFGGARASGGPVSSGKTYLVGEQGPELVRFGRNGTVVPNHAIGRGGTSAPKLEVNIINEAGVPTETRRNSSGGVDVIIPLENALAERASRGKGSLFKASAARANGQGLVG